MVNGPQVALPIPGVVHGQYPENPTPRLNELERIARWARGRWPVRSRSLAQDRQAFIDSVRREMADAPADGSPAFASWVDGVRRELARDGLKDRALARAIAAASLVCVHRLGQTPFDSQLHAAAVMLDGRLAEMATGEGKTLAAFLAAAAAALACIPVHLLTANDYLAARDAAQFEPAYRALGLSASCAVPGQPAGLRREVYRASVVYATAREVIFDYLKDRLAGAQGGNRLQSRLMALRREAEADAGQGSPEPGSQGAARAAEPLLRGLCFALIDEADSVLIDEARTPFVLARSEPDAQRLQASRAALALARQLNRGFDVELHPARRAVELTELGRVHLRAHIESLPQAWQHQRLAINLVETALAALMLYRRDVDYVLREGKVEIVDATTGRIAEGRQWSHGLHQMIELKEGCEVTEPQRTVAELSFQRFFPRYLKLGGMSGTLWEAREELAAVYGLAIEVVPLRQPSRRLDRGLRLFSGPRARWRAVIGSIRASVALGRPVLVGTDSVADSVALSRRLTRLGIAHRLLHARHDQEEASIIATAGESGAVTVTTNMAGRGTDIRISDAAIAAGGLHVICCQQNAAARIDRQLYGRSARQGDPGSYETLLTMSSGVIQRRTSAWLRGWLARSAGRDGALPQALARTVVGACRRIESRQAIRQRAQLLKRDETIGERLAFTPE